MEKIGKLYIVAVPIGNPEDITLRALRVLRESDAIAAEDTRNTRYFLSQHQISNHLISYHEHNEDQRSEELLHQLATGRSVALVSDAGTPGVSDPGYRLIHRAVNQKIKVIPIPGPSAAVAALSASGVPTDAFTFLGFPPKKEQRRQERLEQLRDEPRTLIFYQSPVRMVKFLAEIESALGDRQAVLARELTKPYEEFLRGSVSEIRAQLEKRAAVKGECTLLVSGRQPETEADPDAIQREIVAGISEGEKTSALSRRIAQKFGLPKQRIYSQIVEFKKESINVS